MDRHPSIVVSAASRRWKLSKEKINDRRWKIMTASVMNWKTTDAVLSTGGFGVVADQCFDGSNGSICLTGDMQRETLKRIFSRAYTQGIAFHQRVDHVRRTLESARHMDR
mmetsp:Transcript_34156/g.72781  ORF Transcript_34156/g.72781 Transcript_34156/m.72781 type:complete len:110 (+) Transcript_34156:429-758(+)